MKRNKMIASSLVALLLVGANTLSADEKQTDVTISTEAAVMNITVPSTMPMTFKGDGTNVYATNFTIANNSALGDIYLSKVEASAKGDWKLASEGTSWSSVPANTKKIELTIDNKVIDGEGDAAAYASETFGMTDFVIKNASEKDLSYSCKRSAFTDVLNNESAYTLNLTFEFVK